MSAPYMTMADLAKVYGLTPRTLRKWASHDKWRRSGTRPVRWSLADAQRSYEARRNRAKRHLTRKYGVELEQNGGTANELAARGRPLTRLPRRQAMGSMMSTRRVKLYIQAQDISDAPPWAVRLAARRWNLTNQQKADCVRRLQTEHGWTLVKVAKLFGVQQSTVGRWLKVSTEEGRARENEQQRAYYERNQYRMSHQRRERRDRKWHQGNGFRATMWEAQDGKCYLCEQPLGPERTAVIEHDHRCCPQQRSCAICRRGLACNQCNLIIAMAHDDPDLLERIAANLRPAIAMVTARLTALDNENASLLDDA